MFYMNTEFFQENEAELPAHTHGFPWREEQPQAICNLKQSAAWEVWLGMLYCLMVRKSSVAAQDQVCGANPLGPYCSPVERRLAESSKPPEASEVILSLSCSIISLNFKFYPNMIKKKKTKKQNKYFSFFLFFSP